jgi:hypothetical protein
MLLLVCSLVLVACEVRGNERMAVTASIAVSPETDPRSLGIRLRVTNSSDRKIAILNPDMGVPSAAVRWTYSQEAYQTALLISFGYLSISVTDETGKQVPQEPILSSATPALRPEIELAPGDSFEVAIPIGTFYRLKSGKAYLVSIGYGDRKLKVSASSRLVVP